MPHWTGVHFPKMTGDFVCLIFLNKLFVKHWFFGPRKGGTSFGATNVKCHFCSLLFQPFGFVIFHTFIMENHMFIVYFLNPDHDFTLFSEWISLNFHGFHWISMNFIESTLIFWSPQTGDYFWTDQLEVTFLLPPFWTLWFCRISYVYCRESNVYFIFRLTVFSAPSAPHPSPHIDLGSHAKK